ncbi:MAG: type II toxin-antitoxin system VapC family toxin [Nitrospirota bacterium]
MTEFVLDTSVIMSWCFNDETDDYSDSVLAMLSTSEAVIPSICPFEVANVLLVAERRGRLTEADTSRFVSLLESLPIHIDLESPNRLIVNLLALGRKYGLSSYDAAYLELAMREGLSLATRDEALKLAAGKCGIDLV